MRRMTKTEAAVGVDSESIPTSTLGVLLESPESIQSRLSADAYVDSGFSARSFPELKLLLRKSRCQS